MEMSNGYRDVTLKLNRTKSSASFKNDSIIGSFHNNYNQNPSIFNSIIGTPQSPYNPSMNRSISTPNSFLNNNPSVLKENHNIMNGVQIDVMNQTDGEVQNVIQRYKG